MVNFTKGNSASCLPSALRNIAVLLLSLTQGNYITFSGFGTWGPGWWCRDALWSGYLPTFIEQIIAEQPEGPRWGREDVKEWRHKCL